MEGARPNNCNTSRHLPAAHHFPPPALGTWRDGRQGVGLVMGEVSHGNGSWSPKTDGFPGFTKRMEQNPHEIQDVNQNPPKCEASHIAMLNVDPP
jgi:hypothetical protein